MRRRTEGRRRPLLQELEPRILYSADPLLGAAGLAGTLAGEPSLQQEVRLLFAEPAPTEQAAELFSRIVDAGSIEASSHRAASELVFIDRGVEGHEALAADFAAQQAQGRRLEVVLLDTGRDGVVQISEALAGRSGIGAIHLLSHGADGRIRLGDATLDATTLARHAPQIASWRSALAADADLLIYGCDVAAQDGGRQLLTALAGLTGADVAASDDLTGAAASGGDWDLEYHTGVVESDGVFSVAAQSMWHGTLLATPAGAEFQVNTTLANNQTDAAVAMDGGGNFVVVWAADGNQDGNGRGIYAQRFDASGVKLGGEFRVNTVTTDDQTLAAVAMDAGGNFVVTWSSANQDPDRTKGIYGQRFDASGTAQGDEFRVNATTSGTQDESAVAIDGNGHVVVVWKSNHSGDNDIYARRYDAAGTALTGELRVNSNAANSQDRPAVAMNVNGDTVVAWKNSNSVDGSGAGVFAQRFDAGGAAVGGEMQVNSTSSGNQDKPTVAISPGGEFVIAWVSGNNQDGDKNGVYAQRFGATGLKQGGEFLVNTVTHENQDFPTIAGDGSGNFTVAWSSDNQDGNNTGVYAQAFDATGARLGAEFRVNTTTANAQTSPAIAMRPNGDFVVVWQGNSVADNSGIAAQRYRSINTAPVHTVPGAQTTLGSPGLIFSSATGNAISVSDAEAGGLPVQVTLSATHGLLTLSTAAGLTFVSGTGTGEASMSFTGTISAINAALDGLLYKPTPFYSGAASVQIVTDDLGRWGAGGALSDTDSVAISVYQAGSPFLVSGSYVGNETDGRSVTGVGFQADVVIVKGRDENAPATIRTSTMSGDASKELTGTSALAVDQIQSLDSLGFTIGTDDTVNKSARTYDWVAFKASPGWMKVGTYVGAGAAGQSIAGVGFSPDAVFVFSSINDEAVFRTSGAPESYNFGNFAGLATGTIDALDADGFRVGGDDRVSKAGFTYHYIAWKEVAGLMDVGAYTGNGDDDRNIGGVGFRPEYMVVKSLEGDHMIQRFDSQGAADSSTQFTGVSANTNDIQALQADGFQVGSDGDVNANGRGYSYVAWRQQTAPTLSNTANQSTREDAPITVAFTIGDAETAAANLSVMASSSNGTLLPDSALVLGGSGANRTLTLNPAANGSGTAMITVKVSDGASEVVDTFVLTVTAVNDAPAGTNATVTILEDASHAFSASDFAFSDSADTPANAWSAVRITTLPAAGTLRLSGTAVSAGQFVSAANIAAGNLVYTPAANGNGATYASFTFQLQDDGGTANGGVDLDASPNTITVDVTPVGDAPAGSNKTVTVREDGVHTFIVADFGFSDTADSPPDALLGVRLATVPVSGRLTLSGAAVAAGQFVGVSDIAAGNLRFAPAANASGVDDASFTFQVRDDGGTANGGADLDASASTITIDVTSVNDAPAGADKTVTTLEDTRYTFASADFGFTDPNDAAADVLLNVRIATLPVAGTLRNNGSTVTAGQLVSAGDIAAGKLIFTPAANAHGAGYTSFTFQVQDDGGTADGGVDLDASARTITIDVTSVNDEPAGADETVTTLEDTDHTFTAGDFGFTDPGDGAGNAFAGVRIGTLPGAGSLKLSGVALTAGQFVGVADITAGNLVFAPAANARGAGYASFTFQVQDDGGAANGGVDLDAAPNTMTIDVASVNDAPSGTSATVTTLEDTPHTFAAADFGFGDAADSPANGLLNVKITSLPGAGTLANNGVGVTAGQFVSLADIASGKLIYTPAADASGAGHASFTFQVQDDGGTADGGADLDAAPDTITLDVTAVNDAPVNAVPGGQATAQNTAIVFSAANGNAFSVSDVDAGSASVRVTLSVSNGVLTLGATTGLVFVSGDGTSNVSMTFDGSVAGINAALDGMRYDPALNFSGSDVLDVATDDQGNTGAGGALSRTNSVSINVDHVNSAPTLAGANNLAPIDEDASADAGTLVSALIAGQAADIDSGALSGIAVTAVDERNGAWQYSTDGGSGWNALSGVTPATARLLASDANSRIRFVPAAGWSGTVVDGLSFRAWDQTTGSAGNTADVSVNGASTAFSAADASASIVVDSVNDAPSGANKTVTTLEDTDYTFASADFGFSDADDAPANALAAVRIATLPGAGSLRLSGVAVAAGQFVSAADIAAGNLLFTPAANANGPGYASFTFQVQDDGGTANGGIDLDASGNTFTFHVTAVNDAPAGADATVTTLEDTAYTFAVADFGLSDPGDAVADALSSVKITTLPASGSLTLSGVAMTAGQFVSAADIAAGKLVFAPAADVNGAGTASFTFQVQDDGGTANGGVDLDATARVMTFAVTPVNDAPVRTAGSVANLTVLEDLGLTSLGLGALAYSRGGGADEAGQTLTFTVTAVPAAALGELVLADGRTVVAPGVYTLAQLQGMQLRTTVDGNGGPAAFSFTVSDGAGTSNGGFDSLAESLNISVTPRNDAPVRTAGSVVDLAVLEDSGLTSLGLGAIAYGRGGGADEAGQTLTVAVTALPPSSLGDVVLADGTTVVGINTYTLAEVQGMQFRRAADASGGPAIFSFTVTDNGGTANSGADTLTESLTITVTEVNDAPAGADKTVTTPEDTGHTFISADFGFSDANDAPANALAAVRITTLPGAGSLRLSGVAVAAGQFVSAADIAAGNLLFTPAANANGAGYASFTFQVQDDGGTANGGIDLDASPNAMTIHVTAVNDAPVANADTLAATEDTPVTYTAAQLLGNDSDVDGNTLTIAAVTSGVGGSATLNGDGTVTFTPSANFNGAAGFSYTASDGTLGSNSASVSVNVAAVNDAPSASADTLEATEDTPVTYTAVQLLGNDSDVDGNTLTIASVTSGIGGSATLNGDGTVTFTPSANFNGAAGFSYTASDGTLGSNSASVSVNVAAVNDAPVASADTVVATEDTTATYTAAQLLGNDSDVDGNTLTIASVTGGAGGSATLNGDGTVTFTPSANFNGAAGFSYIASDGTLGSNSASVSVNVAAVNDAPSANADTLEATEDTPVTYTAVQLLGNDSDVDGNTLTIASVTGGAGGSATLNGDGTVTFTPNANFNGAAGFSYTASDGTLGSNSASVSVNVAAVNDAPSANADTLEATEDTPVTYTAVQLLGNDSDVDGNTLTIASVTGGAGGSATLNGDGTVTFTPNANFNGAAGFSYTASDGTLGSNSASVSVNVAAVNDAPSANADTLAATEDTPVTYTAVQLLGNDSDVDGNTLTIASVTSGVGGSATLNGDGTVTFTPNANFNGAAGFSYTASDGTLGSNSASVSVNVAAVNDAPVANADTLAATEDTPVTYTAVQLLGNDSDVDGNTLTIASVTSGVGGSATLNGDGTVTFTPSANFNGAAGFSYTASDGTLGSNSASVSVNVAAVNDAPVASADTVVATEDTTATYTAAQLLGNDSDVDGNTLTIASVTGGAGGSATLNGDGTVTFTPSANFNGAAGFSYIASDGTLGSNSASVRVNVAAVNDEPSGSPLIVGDAFENRTLYADTSGIADADGLGGFAYQWRRDGAAIASATSDRYLLVDADVGRTISVAVSYVDGGGTAEQLISAATGAVLDANQTALNAPPVLSGANDLGAIDEDASSNSGTLVSALIASQVTDPDAAALAGIAVTAVDDANGSWQYTRDDGSTWQAFATPTESAARLLAADATTRVRFVPNADWNGTVAGGIAFRAWDQTSGTAGSTAAVPPAGRDRVTVLDRFETSSYANNDGAQRWSGAWVEGPSEGGDGPGAGEIRVAGGRLEILSSRAAGPSLARSVDLSGMSGGVLSFSYAANTLSSGSFAVELSSDGGATYATPTGGVFGSGSGQVRLDIGAVLGPQTTIRFSSLGGAHANPSSGFTIDDVQVSAVSSFSAASASASIQVRAVNDAPTGTPRVLGEAIEDRTLSVDASGIADRDGLGAFAYQWLRDGVAITGADGSSLLLGDADVGRAISVAVSYVDGQGTSERLTSTATAPVVNVNDVPIGAPLIVGQAVEDRTLGVDTRGIGDADGLGTFSYQWLRDGVAIAGANDASLLLGDADVGSAISVAVSYVDGQGTAERLTSTATAPVDNVNDVPTGAPLIVGEAIEDRTLSVDTRGIGDADGLGTYTYQWLRDGVAIPDATSADLLLGDADIGRAISVTVSYVDGQGTAERLTSATMAPVVNVNDVPTGAPLVVGQAVEDQTLSVDTRGIADADGLGTYTYQWLRDGVAIAGATDASLLLGDADVGRAISVTVSYVDGQGTSERLTSATTAPVANVNDVPTGAPLIVGEAIEDRTLSVDGSGIGDADGLGTFTYQWLRDGVAIANATSADLLLGAADVGHAISVTVSYIDGQGT